MTEPRPESELLQSLPPRVAEGCRVLLLGSMPSVASLGAANYYAHPRNRFWPLLGQLLMDTPFGFDPRADYETRIAALHAARVGLWDVVGQCRRRGSLDTDIETDSIVANDIPGLLRAHPSIRAIGLNGGVATQLFRRHVQPQLSADVSARLRIHALPSTSPANAGFDFKRLLAAWRVLQTA
ncbi:MAG: DNA-deoxyinosine glycosylase [Solimonas sp.]